MGNPSLHRHGLRSTDPIKFLGSPRARARIFFLVVIAVPSCYMSVGMRVAYSMPANSPDEPLDGSAQAEPGFCAVAASRPPRTVNFSDNRRRGPD